MVKKRKRKNEIMSKCNNMRKLIMAYATLLLIFKKKEQKTEIYKANLTDEEVKTMINRMEPKSLTSGADYIIFGDIEKEEN